jgi:hypothetical protein
MESRTYQTRNITVEQKKELIEVIDERKGRYVCMIGCIGVPSNPSFITVLERCLSTFEINARWHFSVLCVVPLT